ncbi:hypothetical protein MPSEU_000034900 [Mayamaea pseudoterrestris]|nr:hypothetical protein MPSEU_000034900 [Mayamaea pseudoterrestris]
MSTGGMSLSKEFFTLLKEIGESKSKQEEDRIIIREIQRLKQKMETPSSSIPGGAPQQNSLLSNKKRAKEFLVRLLYVEMLGHDASFGYIKAVEMAASASLFHKRTGYLVCAACLPPDHEFRFMLVNQMQRDLQSVNVLECSGGLLAACELITSDMVPAVKTEVSKLLSHESATIRKKAILTLHRFHQLAPDDVTEEEMQEHLRKMLCDKDPAVMGSSLNAIYAMSLMNPLPFKDLVPSLVSILKQICEHRLPSEYDYHRVPAPWMQLQLIRILRVLGKADVKASSGMYEIVHEAMKKADNGINAGYAIAYECVKTIVTIYPNPALLDAAAEAISRFIDSRSHNLKYLGVTGLAMIVETHPQYAAQHQLAVMDCLEDTDETLQRKTLDLLYRMTNPVNVEFITEKLVAFLSGTTDLFLKRVLTTRVCTIAERFAPNNVWYIRTITQLFEVSGDMVQQEVAQNLMSLIAEGTGDSEEEDMLLRQNAVEIYVTILRDKPLGKLPKILLETMAWCLGEYAYLSAVQSLDETMRQLCDFAKSHKSKFALTTRRMLVAAIMKLVAQAGNCPAHAAAVIDDYTRSRDFELQQRCLEFQSILTNCPQLLPQIMPVDASAEDLEVDQNLSFLDGFVQQSLANGARPYTAMDFDDDEDDYEGGNGVTKTAFKMTPYEKPQAPALARMAMSGMGSNIRSTEASAALPPGAVRGGSHMASQATVPPNGGLALNTHNVANVWGKGGLKAQPSPQPSPTAAAPSASAPAPGGLGAWEDRSRNVGAGFGGVASAYGGSGSSAYGAPAAQLPVVKTAEQLEKERQAAALFGGIIPGAPPPVSAPTAPPPPPKSAPVPAPPVPASAPSAASDVDLLDMGFWGDSSTGTRAAASAPAPDFDAVVTQTSEALSSTAIVETVSDDENDGYEPVQDDVVPTSTKPPLEPGPAPVVDDDPFASAGLLGSVQESTLPSFSLSSSSRFEYNGVALAPLPITTAQFGAKWGTCAATSPISVTSTKVSSLDAFMDTCACLGAHKIEAIAATNEGICAGMLGASSLVLIHGKVIVSGAGSAKIDATVKGTDAALCGSLAMYLQTQLR